MLQIASTYDYWLLQLNHQPQIQNRFRHFIRYNNVYISPFEQATITLIAKTNGDIFLLFFGI